MIRWKVVKTNRKSACIDNSYYVLFYEKGEVVTAVENTVGILYFSEEEYAEKFRDRFNFGYGPLEIIQIQPLEEETEIERLGNLDCIDHFYEGKELGFPATKGTLACQSVEVLE